MALYAGAEVPGRSHLPSAHDPPPTRTVAQSMSIKKYPLQSLQKVRKYIRQTLDLPEIDAESESYLSDDPMSEPDSLDDLSGIFTFGGTPMAEHPPSSVQDEWFVSTVNPGAALLKIPGLQVKPEYRLVSYLYRSQQSGMGAVWAVPTELSNMTQLEQALQGDIQDIRVIPKPPRALDNFMEAIRGDRSHSSFLMASILHRELQEFGALAERQNWSHHNLIDQIPVGKNWQWQATQPKDLMPKVRLYPDGKAAVELFSCRSGDTIQIYRHLDQYPPDGYRPMSLDKPMAIAL